MATDPKLPIPFDPVPVRHSGWTVERQFAFVEKLADTGSIAAAARVTKWRKWRKTPFHSRAV